MFGSAFFSEISPGDFVSIRASEQISGGAIVDIDMLLLLASKTNTTNVKNTKLNVNENEIGQISNRRVS